MCYSDDARPPLPPIGGAASDQADLTLTTADNNRFMAYAARAAKPDGRGMVILPDVRGLFPFYKELTIRFAEAGFEAVALDYFGRTATDSDRGAAFDWQQHTPLTTRRGSRRMCAPAWSTCGHPTAGPRAPSSPSASVLGGPLPGGNQRRDTAWPGQSGFTEDNP